MNSTVHLWTAAAAWAQGLSDADLEASLETLRAERDVFDCPFESGHPECRCEEHAPIFFHLSDRIDAVRMEMYLREGMTAHQKMARIAEARAELGVAI